MLLYRHCDRLDRPAFRQSGAGDRVGSGEGGASDGSSLPVHGERYPSVCAAGALFHSAYAWNRDDSGEKALESSSGQCRRKPEA